MDCLETCHPGVNAAGPAELIHLKITCCKLSKGKYICSEQVEICRASERSRFLAGGM